MKKLPLTIISPGTQKHNFTHIEDIMENLILIGENGCDDDLGIGSSNTFSITEIANFFGDEIEMLLSKPGNRLTSELVSEKRALGWIS